MYLLYIEKCIYKNVFALHISFEVPQTYDFVVLTYLTHPTTIPFFVQSADNVALLMLGNVLPL
jgi:hypothetical protein